MTRNPTEAKNCRKCLWLRIAAVTFWSLVLVVLSLLPNGNTVHLFDGQDKALHFLAYLFAAWLLCRTLHALSVRLKYSIAISIGYGLFFGGLLEVLQSLVTTSRSPEWLDLLADVLGAICGCAIFCLTRKKESTA